MIPTTAFFMFSLLADFKFMWIRHQYDIPTTEVTFGLKMVLTVEVLFAAGCTLTKLSMLMLVRRMLETATLFWRRITLLAITIVAVQGSLFCIILIFQCRPPQDYWALSQDPQPTCIHQTSALLVAGTVNTLTDLLVVLLPIRTVWSLQLPTRQAALIILLFGFGFVSCCAGITRTYYTYRVTQVWDQTWHSYPVWITSAVELYIGVICASLPATKPFFAIYLPSLLGPLSSSLRSSNFHRSHSHNIFSSSGRNHTRTNSIFHEEELLERKGILRSRSGDLPSESSGNLGGINVTKTVDVQVDLSGYFERVV